MHSFSRAHCLAAGRGRRSCLALHGSASSSGLRSPYASSPMHQAVSCSTLFYLWTGSSSPVASHPVSRRRSFLRLRTASVLSDGDFHPIVGAHSQAHVGKTLCVCRCGWRRHKYPAAANAYSKPFQRPYRSSEAKGIRTVCAKVGERLPKQGGKGSKAHRLPKGALQTRAIQIHIRTVSASENYEVATLPFLKNKTP